MVDTQYFRTMEVPLMAGRNFSATDTSTTQAVAVIDQTLARRYWPDQDPLGQQVKFGFGAGSKGVTIVGVVGDIKSDGFEAAQRAAYICCDGAVRADQRGVVLAQQGRRGTSGRSRAAGGGKHGCECRGAQHQHDGPNHCAIGGRPAIRFGAAWGFAAVALLLAAIGIYGVMSYAFSQRTHEVGIRMALGAQRLDILRMALVEGMRIVLIGLVAGVAGAAVMTRIFPVHAF